MEKRIRGILFDLGDTLLNFGRLDIPTLFEAGARLAYDYLKSLRQPVPSFAKFHRQQLWAIRWSYFKSHITRREFSSLETIGELSRRMGHDLSPQQTLELAWLWYEPVSRCATVEAGAVDLLQQFRSRGLALGLISNTFVPAAVLDRHLQQTGLLDLLPVRVYSCDVRYRKPNRKIFRKALDDLGLQARQTLFVGDSLQADVNGANRAGLISVLKDPLDRFARINTKAAHRVRQLAELEDIVSRYNG